MNAKKEHLQFSLPCNRCGKCCICTGKNDIIACCIRKVNGLSTKWSDGPCLLLNVLPDGTTSCNGKDECSPTEQLLWMGTCTWPAKRVKLPNEAAVFEFNDLSFDKK